MSISVEPESPLAGQTILVTGGTGFIGRRLVDRLARVQGASVRALVRNQAGAAAVGALGATPVVGAMGDAASLANAIRGCTHVAHLAFDAAAPGDNLRGLENLARASAEAKVQRLVHLSTAAVYEPLGAGTLRETAPLPAPATPYAAVKRAMEVALVRFAGQGLAATILQPAIVYGPHSPTWIDLPVRHLINGTLVLPAGGAGIANLVYVDDVCMAIERALVAAVAAGERFLISGDDPVTWGAFYGWLDGLVGRRSLRLLPQGAAQGGPAYKLRRAVNLALDTDRVLGSGAVRKLPSAARRAVGGGASLLKTAGLRPTYYPPVALGQLYAAQCTIDIAKAKAGLGFHPAISFDQGCRETVPYIRGAFGSYFSAAA